MLNVANDSLRDAADRFAALFERSAAPRPRRIWELYCLLALLVAAAMVRFWGLGSFGLHKPDEDTTVLAALHILQDGLPRFPSGMFYARALAQSYLIAASVALFGQNEWAMRLPSVLCGLSMVAMSWYVGRRFLRPVWNLALVAVVAFLPGLIADSQEARMYIFLLASLTAYAALVFRWEATERVGWLAAATAAMIVAIQFQQLAIFGCLIVFFPALVRGDIGKLRAAAFSCVPIVGYFGFTYLGPNPYPELATDYATALPTLGAFPSAQGLRFHPLPASALLLVGAWLALRARAGRDGRGVRAAMLLLFAGLIAQAGLCYHLAGLMYLTALVVAVRNGMTAWKLLPLGALMLATLVLQLLMLERASGESLYKMIGMLVGRPSIWPLIILARYSPLGAAIVGATLAVFAGRIATHRKIPDYALFFVLAVWLPLLAMGMTGWYFPPRYVEFALLPLLITALAAGQTVLTVRRSSVALTVGAATACVMAIVNPVAAARAVNAGARFPDHRAAARFMQGMQLAARDLVLAEEILMQTYYLGHVDYWLVDKHVAAQFVERVNGRILDQYTHTPVIGSGAELQQLIDRPERGAIYVIGSGEGTQQDRLALRGREIFDLLASDRFKVVFVARDGVTKIWKVDAPTPVPGTDVAGH